ncbi:uncharacterized protein [Anabrus simplex]|uniref:uncharacterized protein n=1 Tax=Anabrus simplex TaxID=316456 RepID=UPI0035A32999
MDMEVKIKEEPTWLEGTTTASLENTEYVSEVITLKAEIKSELTEPRSTQEKSLEPSEDTKEEIFIEEQTDDQLLPYIKEETNRRTQGVLRKLGGRTPLVKQEPGVIPDEVASHLVTTSQAPSDKKHTKHIRCQLQTLK